MSKSVFDEPAVKDARELADKVVTDIPKWQEYVDGCVKTILVLEDLPDVSAEEKARWATYILLSAAVEASSRISEERKQSTSREADAIAAKYGIPPDETREVNLDETADISGLSRDVKVLVAAGIVAAFDLFKGYPNKDVFSFMKQRFNAHAAGIQPGEIPASLHAKMMNTVEKVRQLAP